VAEFDEEWVARLFAGLMPDVVIDAYCRLLAAGKIPKEQAEEFLGGAAIMAELTRRGLAHPVPHSPTSPPSFQAVPPELALVAVMTGLQATASRAHEQLVACYARLADAQARAYAGGSDDSSHVVRVLTDRNEILRLSLDLINSARREFLSLEPQTTVMPVTDDYTVALPPALQGGRVRVRAIYDQASVEHPAVAETMRRSREAGEEQRVLPKLPMKMQLADEVAVLLPVTETGTDMALLIRGSVPIVAGLRHYFELLWDLGVPVGSGRAPGSCPLSRAQLAVLNLLAQGLTDKAIAHKLDISDSTVHRHITAIMHHLGVSGRFAAGVAADRRGWIGDQEATND
jgi:DNA-binding CsgD family transcriptional regulator